METKITKKQLIDELIRVSHIDTTRNPSRDFFRAHSKLKDRWNLYFATFSDFVIAAGLKVTPSTHTEIPIEKRIELDRQRMEHKKDDLRQRYEHMLNEYRNLREDFDVAMAMKEKTPQLWDIEPKVSTGTSESVAFMIASDWHSEERVLPGDVGGSNEFNLEIFDKRSEKFFQGGQHLIEILGNDTQIKTIVLGLLGDFISNTLHEDQAESNLLMPADAIYRAQWTIYNGIRFLLANTEADIICVCHSGNHGRMTKKQRHTTESGNSIEQFMYYNLRDLLKDEPRVKFQIATGYHTYLTLFDKYTIRFHHGHNIKFNGGVGGIYIPVNKAINQWNKLATHRNVNLDVFGHFHTYIDAGNFVANGSIIGYNSYAVAIKADFERPQQAFFLVSKKYMAKTMATPIFVE